MHPLGYCPNYLSPPLPPFGQLAHLYSDVKIHDLKVSLGLKTLLYYTCERRTTSASKKGLP